MKEIRLEATIENIPSVVAFIDEALEAAECGMKAQMQIDVALDEILANIAHYAYAPGTGEVVVRIDIDDAARVATITFIDSGMPFDPLQKDDPDITRPAEERAIGGLGIFLVKKTMDAMAYRREDGRNCLTLQKRI
ncbi:MAG: ATP-binding protein [Clostridia bacterium]|nr:ATP-binding protein [Clostridia bacterium]